MWQPRFGQADSVSTLSLCESLKFKNPHDMALPGSYLWPGSILNHQGKHSKNPNTT
jgi:hypothetical protein